MARPKFVVKHLVACTNAAWEGPPGPKTARTLEGVNYTYPVSPDAESPELDFWLYARFYLTNGVDGTRAFAVEVYWLDAPEGERWVTTRPLGRVRYRAAAPVTNAAWWVSGIQFPGRGRFEFRLLCANHTRYGRVFRPVGSEGIQIE